MPLLQDLGQERNGSVLLAQVITREFAVAEDLREEPTTESLPAMHRHNSTTTVRMAQEVVTTLRALKCEAPSPERSNHLSPAQCSMDIHRVTAIR